MALLLPYELPNSYIIRLLPPIKAYRYTNIQFRTLLIISASLLISSNRLLLLIRRSNKLLPKPTLLIDNTILKTLQATVRPEIVNTDPAATSEPVITTPSTVIVTITLRSRVLYIRDPNTAYRSIYRRNKRLRRLDSRVETSTDLDLEIPVTSINALVVLIYSILPNLKEKRIIRVVKTNWWVMLLKPYWRKQTKERNIILIPTLLPSRAS
jgi:hypothetical protein